MRHLFKDWQKLRHRLKGREFILLFDYDGTLTPIVKRSQDARLPAGIKRQIEALRKKRVLIGIISGRRLSDIRKKVAIGGIYYAGNHGLEISGPDFKFLHPGLARILPCLKRLKYRLQTALDPIKGCIVEDKYYSISVHFRLVSEVGLIKLRKAFRQIVRPYIKTGRIRVTSGKKVWEIRPAINWHKGKAVLRLINSLTNRPFPIYLGDDTTDEDAFRAIRHRGIGVYIGRKNRRSCAAYFLRDIREVSRFLNLVSGVR